MKQFEPPSRTIIDGVVVQQRKVIVDNRGRLGEILRKDDPNFKGFGQAYFTTGRVGVVKAFHLHKIAWDYWYVAHGDIQLVLYDGRQGSKTEGIVNVLYLGEHNPISVLIPPHVVHGFKTVSAYESIIINIPSEPYDYQNPDEYRIPPHGTIPFDWSKIDG